jgi:catechol 2,3-dioxygenase-like lactoylglutathione lyase family enzyme
MLGMGRGIQVTFDAADPHALARWWAGLLGYQVQDTHDFVTKLLGDGVITEADVVEIDGRKAFADATAANDPTGTGPRLYFQRVPEPKTAKNRVHLDIPVDQEHLDAEVERVQAIGATLVGLNSLGGHRFAVMRDPEGNEFCLH